MTPRAGTRPAPAPHRQGRVEDARKAYERALEVVYSDAERRFLEGRPEKLSAESDRRSG